MGYAGIRHWRNNMFGPKGQLGKAAQNTEIKEWQEKHPPRDIAEGVWLELNPGFILISN